MVGKTTIGSGHALARRIRFGLVALAATALAATVLVATATVLPAAATTTTDAQIVVPSSFLYQVACANPTTCYAVGQTINVPNGPIGGAAIFPITNGVPGPPHTLPQGFRLSEVVCPSVTTCVAYGTFKEPGPRSNPTTPRQVVITNGIFGDPQVTPFIYSSVDCFTVAYCVGLTTITESPGVVRQAVVVITNVLTGEAGTPQLVPAGVETLNEVACANIRTCYAVGQSPPDPSKIDIFGDPLPNGVVLPITDGLVGTVQVVPAAGVLYNVACASATTCYAIGPNTDNFQQLVVPIVNGIPGPPKAVPGTNIVVGGIACLSPAICETVGFNDDGAIVVPIINGTPGPAHVVTGANGLLAIACSAPNCVAIGNVNVPNSSTVGVVTLITEPDLMCNGQIGTVVGTAGVDKLFGTSGPDVMVGLGGDDSIYGYAGDDSICAGAGNDVVSAGDGNDLVEGGAGNDRISGDAGNDDLRGGDGSDRIFAVSGNDQLDGGPATDYCYKGTGTNAFTACEVFPAGM